MLDEYFPDVSFFKPTGDGLLLVKAVDAATGQDDLRGMVSKCLALDENFARICEKDWLINFDTPAHVGIGIARSTATRLTAGNKTLDYSGYPLNLASRLMDLARPHGVLFDESLGPDLLEPELLDKFTPESVYVRGLADVEPLVVYRTNSVDIPVANRSPFGAELFREERVTKTLATIQSQGPRFVHRLKHVPLSVAAIQIHIRWPATTSSGGKADHYHTLTVADSTGWDYETEADEPRVVVRYDLLTDRIANEGCKKNWNVDFDIDYPVPVGTSALGEPTAPVEALVDTS